MVGDVVTAAGKVTKASDVLTRVDILTSLASLIDRCGELSFFCVENVHYVKFYSLVITITISVRKDYDNSYIFAL